MSLESDVANLVTKSNALIDYFNTKKAGIDSAVSAAIAAIPQARKTFYVHQLDGLDTNDGTLAAPLKTIDRALLTTPYGGICIIYLLADYALTTQVLGFEGRFLEIRSYDPANQRALRPAYYTASGGQTILSGFSSIAGAAIALREVGLVLPTQIGFTPPTTINNCFVRTINAGSSPLLAMKMSFTTVTEVAGATALLIGADGSAITLGAQDTTFPSGFAGRYVRGAGAGVNPATLNNVLTNLSTL